MDDAFVPLHRIIAELLTFEELVDDDAGVRSYVHRCTIESPVELDISADGMGQVRIGTSPPIYNVRTSFLPSFHRLSFMAELEA